MEQKRLELVSFILFFVVILFLAFFVFQPFLHIIVLAGVLSVLLYPVQSKLVSIFKGGNSFFSFCIVCLVLIFIIIPVLFFGLQVLNQTQSFFALTHAGQVRYLDNTQSAITSLVRHIFPKFSFNIYDYVSKVNDFISSNLAGLISHTAYIFFATFLLSFSFFFFLRDGEKILESLLSFSPFGKEQSREILDSLRRTVASVIRGTLFVGLIRWVILTLGFYIFGIPDALLWGTVAGIIGAIPGLGTPVAVIPAVVYLALYSNLFVAVGMLAFGGIVMFCLDNLLSVYFFGKGLQAPSIFILFSILGGIVFFGPLGFIFGPLILSLLISGLDMYKILILKK